MVTHQVAELTGLRDLTGWPAGVQLAVRRVKPSRRDPKKLTAFERRTGWRYQIVATNIPSHQGLSGVPGSGQVWFVDAPYPDTPRSRTASRRSSGSGWGCCPRNPGS
ncbi:hypothetical protein AB0N07_46895 [Streptomyces sp. NPDC051172]|uniref:hypothetical protein n=1 Tax=Streptomyces sp. NPDC051172 TaxID=3155796 RepID=UPI003427659F